MCKELWNLYYKQQVSHVVDESSRVCVCVFVF